MKIWKAIAATTLSAALFHFGTGLHPIGWLTWLAPLPVLLLAPRVDAGTAPIAGFFAWAVGQVAMWPYFLDVVEMPLPVVAASQLGTALIFGLTVAAFRALLLRGRPLSAATVVPAAWVVTEYAVSLALPHGAWWSLAYTQADVLPVLQTASATGVWGITFLLMAVPSAIAVVLRPGLIRSRAGGPGPSPTPHVRGVIARSAGGEASGARPRADGVRVAAVFGAVVLLALGYGGWRLRTAPAPRGEKVALISTDHPNDVIALDSPQGRDLVNRYASRIERLASDGARVVVLPEKTFLADDDTLPTLTRPLARIARTHRVDVVAGLVRSRGDALYNVALDFPASGGEPVEYTKHHLIPGLEDDLRPGKDLAFAPDTQWGLIICKDLDYPDLVRSYRAAGATALYAPAWDFGDDGWLHSRIAVVRGVENGLAIARVPRAGQVTVSDPSGRIVAEAATTDAEFVTVTTALPAPAAATLYTRLGDWFAWLCIVVLTLTLGAPLLRPRRAGQAARPKRI
ncbi:nitrilase-related carbon-nitrogen hydrolase [Nonomuraea sp. NPDC050153]|uniref:nitrilase-related carbon-nitrogen hydrolase n=1 Tax=Nonomuraea sp. NPDC050153 TaxID=3364359 RepID=UPI00379FA84A